jgi:hypothetical protein
LFEPEVWLGLALTSAKIDVIVNGGVFDASTTDSSSSASTAAASAALLLGAVLQDPNVESSLSGATMSSLVVGLLAGVDTLKVVIESYSTTL